MVVSSLGHSGRKYRREATGRLRAIVSEIDSAPRVTAAPHTGVSLDLTTTNSKGQSSDFNVPARRSEAERLLDEPRPQLILESPMCTALSAWQHINDSKRDPVVTSKEYARGLSHLKFCCELHEYQAANGRYVLHEHPSQAMSWCTAEVQRIMNLEEVDRSAAHLCQYGAQHEGHPIKKCTGLMSNSIDIRKA